MRLWDMLFRGKKLNNETISISNKSKRLEELEEALRGNMATEKLATEKCDIDELTQELAQLEQIGESETDQIQRLVEELNKYEFIAEKDYMLAKLEYHKELSTYSKRIIALERRIAKMRNECDEALGSEGMTQRVTEIAQNILVQTHIKQVFEQQKFNIIDGFCRYERVYIMQSMIKARDQRQWQQIPHAELDRLYLGVAEALDGDAVDGRVYD